ncbi:RES family NAD+ phosphorylase [Pseudomonas sp. SbB1]|uniref:RES domain protein n=1 Tax=Pseudomonas putida (strain GB-1) TaxID=76869 RepID=B0KIZ2_PSEPG|nr:MULTISPECIES: HEPN-associated N-terminal domain-containing protein [Pseudomonas]ABZ00682.1 RES domain protein [Pseudomonas putida GB-1]MBP0711619.1 RES domain-containing protein [Pseudomonas sp. T34]MCK2191076.1 HEPN-associated N-terminal domain-containing protein [Pseudomonas sp. MB04B]MDD2088479.1 HEPN-associated N-terminal domain-containing protein [Pseudomonas putida]MDD2098453.1 HEPN-associated N-terminal domain-containing protein [Pseudomonas putida]
MQKVCIDCIGDEDLKQWIRELNSHRGCSFCSQHTLLAAPLGELCQHIERILEMNYGKSANELPFCSAEGGYLGDSWSTYELLFEECCLDLPNDVDGSLRMGIIGLLVDDNWCRRDWVALDEDEAMRFAWGRFCNHIKHERRYFFQNLDSECVSYDSYSPVELLAAIAQLVDAEELIITVKPGLKLFRARPGFKGRNPTAKDFGPPPREVCQSNRMNPAGVPMFYGALDRRTAVYEVKERISRIGCFEVVKPLRLLDLSSLPMLPGAFSTESPRRRLLLSFLHYFTKEIMQPVARDDRVHTEYVPSQVVTEFLRDFNFESGRIDGVMYGSVASPKPGRRNVVLFLEDLEPEQGPYFPKINVPLKFLRACIVRL